MDIKRTVLILGLAIVSYALVVQWNNDYGDHAEPVVNTQNASAASLPAAETAASDDVPVAIDDQENLSVAVTPVNTASSNLIKVETDVLQLAIDPHGGDIVELKLTQYPKRSSQPDIPFQLFEHSQERLYVAQSGLIGSDGPDARSVGRPLYRSAQQNYTLKPGQDSFNVDLQFNENGIHYTKRFTFHRGLNTA